MNRIVLFFQALGSPNMARPMLFSMFFAIVGFACGLMSFSSLPSAIAADYEAYLLASTEQIPLVRSVVATAAVVAAFSGLASAICALSGKNRMFIAVIVLLQFVYSFSSGIATRSILSIGEFSWSIAGLFFVALPNLLFMAALSAVLAVALAHGKPSRHGIAPWRMAPVWALLGSATVIRVVATLLFHLIMV